MRKEVLIAIILGAALGLIIAFGVWRANLALAPKRQAVQTQATPTPEAFALTISSPENEAVVGRDSITVQGTTKAGVNLVILYENGEILTTAQEDGSFEADIKLIAGANSITVTAFDEEGESVEKTLTVVYSTEFPPKEEE